MNIFLEKLIIFNGLGPSVSKERQINYMCDSGNNIN